MTDTRHIRISDYQYSLPDERIAKYPLSERDHSKLLVYRQGTIEEDVFCHLPQHLPHGALMVFNNTRVIRARLNFFKQTGAHIEVFLLEPASPADYEQIFQAKGHCAWTCMIGNLKKWKDGQLENVLQVGEQEVRLTATRRGESSTGWWVDFEWTPADISFSEIVEACGQLPIPPYLNRKTEESDLTTYQTVYSKIKGSVAAPTAGLHFTQQVLEAIDARGIDREEVTLHVGAGTFKPVKSQEMDGHVMHSEHFVVRRQTLEQLLRHGASAIAVGTTSVRTLESLYFIGCKLAAAPQLSEEDLHVGQWEPYEQFRDATLTAAESLQHILDWMDANGLHSLHSSTQIIIAPGYRYRIVRMLVTNFHQPQSTLLLLVSALVGDDWHRIYDYALSHDFRFLSYGDSSLLIP